MARKKIKVEVVTKDDAVDKRSETEAVAEAEVVGSAAEETLEGLSGQEPQLEDRSAETPAPAAVDVDGAAEPKSSVEAEAEVIDELIPEEAADELDAVDETDILEAAAQIVDDAAAADEAAAQAAARIAELEAAVAAAKQEAADAKDRHVRLQAEWDNYRKRTASEREAERLRATERLVKELAELSP